MRLYTPLLNRLLAGLPTADYNRLLPHLELVPLPAEKVMQDPAQTQDHVFFPISGVLSLSRATEDGVHHQIALVGHEGAVGFTPLVNGEDVTLRAVVQIPGFTYRVKANLLKTELERGGALHLLLQSYLATVIKQETQAMTCSRLHAVEQQLCRWLLLGMDRHSSNDLNATVASDLLNIDRKGFAEAAVSLEAAGLVRFESGRMTVLDRVKLETRVCECYGIVSQEISRFASSVNAA